MSKIMLSVWLSLAAFSIATPALANPAATAAEAGRYSTSATDIGTLLDDPASKALLDKYIPGMTSSDQIDLARAMTLKDIQAYSPDSITDKVLADLDSEFAKLPAKR